jgi:sugar/nucleoside kinase (ribokinase family)
MIGCVGEDQFGTLNIERLRASGVDVRGIRRVPQATTGIAFVTYRADGGRDFIFTIGSSAAARLGPEHVEPALLEGCRIFHVMGSSLFNERVTAAIRRGAELAKSAGARISFDPNVRKELLTLPGVEATMADMLKACDILLPSEADLEHLAPGRSEAEAAASLLAGTCAMIVVKRGARGSALYRRDAAPLALPAFPSEEVDPTGAGDCFGGTFIASLAREEAPDRALMLATAAGALAVRRKGPMEGNSTLAEIEAFLAQASRP